MNDQSRHVYKKIESGSIINIDTIKQEIDQDVDQIDDTNSKINPYHKIIVNKAEKRCYNHITTGTMVNIE